MINLIFNSRFTFLWMNEWANGIFVTVRCEFFGFFLLIFFLNVLILQYIAISFEWYCIYLPDYTEAKTWWCWGISRGLRDYCHHLCFVGFDRFLWLSFLFEQILQELWKKKRRNWEVKLALNQGSQIQIISVPPPPLE